MKTYEQQINALIDFLAEDGTDRPLSIAHPVGSAIRHIEALEAEIKRLKEGECTPTIKSKATNEKKFTCYYESVLTQIHDPTGRALTIGEIVELLNDRERLRLYERACESMAKQFICPKMTGEQLARKQLEF